MKRFLYLILVLPFALQAQNPVTNQRVYDTIPFIPEHTTDKVAQFEKDPIVTSHIIFLGNSITEMGNWKKVLNDTTVINRGIGGDITYGILRRLKEVTDAVIADNMLKIVNRVHAACPQTKIYVQSVLPLNPTMPNFPQHYDKEEHVLALNKLYKANAAAGNYTFINIFPLFLDKDQHLDAQYSYEGLHLKPPAYDIWAAYLKKQGYL